MLFSMERRIFSSHFLKLSLKLPRNLLQPLPDFVTLNRLNFGYNRLNYSDLCLCKGQFTRHYKQKYFQFVKTMCPLRNLSSKRIYCNLNRYRRLNECIQRNVANFADSGKHKERELCETVALDPDFKEFCAALQGICKDLTQEDDHILSTVAKRLDVMINYNVSGGKKSRGMAVVSAYKKLSKETLTAEGLKEAHVLGWCVELLQSFFLVSDDIMDNGMTRRGKACWFRLPEVGLEAVNDALLLECSVYQLLKIHFENKKYYTRIVDEFHKVTKSTVWGQCLDMASSPTGHKPRLERFNPSVYWTIVEYKTTYYTYSLPINLAMHIIGSFSENHYNLSKAICVKLGKMFQMQDDYLDVYGDPKVTGKVGSDIKEGKCSWLAITALELCSEEGKTIMKENYGIADPSAVNKVLQLYDALTIREKFYKMEDQLYAEISSLISALDNDILDRDMFTGLLRTIYKRQK